MSDNNTPLFECLSYNCTRVLWQGIKQKLRTKVDVVQGKGLSTNDFTTSLKNKLTNLPSSAENFAVCDTAASTQIKTVTSSTFGNVLNDNARITVRFSNTNSTTNPKLNVNSTGSFFIRYHGTNIDGEDINVVANGIYELMYKHDANNNTGYWDIIGDMNDASSGSSSSQAYTVSYDATNEAIVITNNTAGAVSVSNEIIIFS